MTGVDTIETVRWNTGTVRLLDQTRLPDEETYLEIDTVDGLIKAIQALAVRGAPAIGVAGAYGVALAAHITTAQDLSELFTELEHESRRIREARPTAVNLAWAVDRIWRRIEISRDCLNSPDDLRGLCLAESHRILKEDLELSQAMAIAGAELLPDEGRVITHCNTGGLATGGGGTALGVVLEAARRGKRIFVHVDETRPLLQGARLTAWELERAGVPHAVQCDGAAAWAMRTHEIDAVFVGADRIAGNGDGANKIGTYALALAAKAHGVPFYFVAPRSSFDLSLSSGEQIPIEERDEGEVLEWQGRRTAPKRSRAWNPAFDVTPAELVTGWISERGLEHPPFQP